MIDHDEDQNRRHLAAYDDATDNQQRPAAQSRSPFTLLVHKVERARDALGIPRHTGLGPILVVACFVLLLLIVFLDQRMTIIQQLRAINAQSDMMSSQLKILQQVAQASTAAVRTTAQLAQSNSVAAEAAQQSASLADQTLRVSQRAYLVPHPPEVINLFNKPLEIQTTLVNQGQTAAGDVQTYYGQAIFQDTTGIRIDFAHAPRIPGETGNITMQARGERTIGYVSATGIASDDMRRLTTGHGSLVVYGSAAYSDVFAKPHFLHFCKMYQFDTSGSQVRTAPCPSWNDTQ